MPTKLLDRPALAHPERALYRPGIEVVDFRREDWEHRFHNEELGRQARDAHGLTMAFGGPTEQAVLASMFGNCCGAVRTTIAAATAAQTTIQTGSLANAGASGNMDQTPNGTAMIWTGKPGTGSSINQYTNPHAFLLTAAAATSLTIASQSMGLVLTAGDVIFLGGSSSAGGSLSSCPAWNLNTLFIGLTTQAVSGATQTNILSGEPTSTGSYARISLFNNQANMPLPSAAVPSVLTAGGPFSFAASSAAWSTGSTNLVQMFISDSPTLGGGNVLAFGALGTPQAVNAASITLAFAAAAITLALT